MPTYEYQCSSCGSVFDVFQSIKAAPLRKAECETCGEKRPVRRLIGTGGAVIFKGSGFYQTDYRSEGYKKAAKSETDTGTSSETGKDAMKKPDPKPADSKSPGDHSGAQKDSAQSKSSKKQK